MSLKNDILVIGGGPAGLMAAGMAASQGCRVLLLEKMKMPARKLRITGKGRCNITNTAPLHAFLSEIGPEPRFLRPAFLAFFSEELIQFLHSIDIPTLEERGGRIFPESQNAVELSEKLVRWATKQGVRLQTEANVIRLRLEDDQIVGLELSSGEKPSARNIILATGGKSYPATGSTGDGYKLAAGCGHAIVSPQPVLVPLTVSDTVAQSLQGLSLKNVRVNVWVEGKKAGSEFGEMLFTHFGLSGPLILTLSRQFCNEIKAKKQMIFSIDLKPALDDQTLEQRILRDFNAHGKRHFGNLLREYLPGKLSALAPELLKIDPEKETHQITAEERKRFRRWLKDFRFEITGFRGWNEAIITRGGVSLTQIDPKTMGSRIIKGLYFAGEVIDLDANTGGYNLQIAFSTGHLAGLSAAANVI